jgi:transcriptional regulator with XRE-family HTH domain
MTQSTFGAKLRAFRKRERLTQRELADALGLDFTYVSKIEGDRVPPPAREKIERAVEILKLSPDERIDLFVSAEKLPVDMETWVTNRPDAYRLYRSMRSLSADKQNRLFDELIKRAEREHGPADREECD